MTPCHLDFFCELIVIGTLRENAVIENIVTDFCAIRSSLEASVERSRDSSESLLTNHTFIKNFSNGLPATGIVRKINMTNLNNVAYIKFWEGHTHTVILCYKGGTCVFFAKAEVCYTSEARAKITRGEEPLSL